MKRKIYVILLLFCFLLVGCGKETEKSVLNDISKKYEKPNSYNVVGVLEIINNEDVYKYDIDASYKKGEFYRVSLKNQSNNHEQIILKNKDGVYVLTPSLNKSFKFQSEWPYNNSQIYLLSSIIKDIKSDNEKKYEMVDGSYIFTSKVNYPNNRKLIKQKAFYDKDKNLTKVEVVDENDNVQMRMSFTKIDLKASFDDKKFALNDNMQTTVTNEGNKTVSKIDDIIYPMYMPVNTTLESQDKVSKTDGERVILTFAGDNPFMLIEETASYEDEMTIVPMYGDPEIILESVGAISDNSITWVNNNIEYYLVSDKLSKNELLEVAKSLGSLPVSK